MQVTNPYAWLLFVTALLAAAALPYVWQRRFAPGARPILVMLAGVIIWSFGYAMELFSSRLGTMLFWARVEYIGTVSVPTAWLLYSLEYTGKIRWLRRRNILLFQVIPLLILAMVWTNDWHHLYYRQVSTIESGGFTYLNAYDRGPFYWVNLVYANLIILGGTFSLMRALLSAPHLYRRQIGTMLVGALAPWVGSLFYIFQLAPVDITPIGFAVTSLAVAISATRFQLFEVIPLARDWLVENMETPVIVLNDLGEIVDVNQAAREFFRKNQNEAGATTLLRQSWTAMFTPFEINLGPLLSSEESHLEVYLGKETPHWYDVRVRPMREKAASQVDGWIITIQDIHARKQAEKQLTETRDQAIQASLVKSQFIASINHDLSLPLATLLESGAVLLSREDDPLSPIQQKAVQAIFQSTNQMSRYISDLADLPVSQDGKITLFVTEFMPVELLARLRALFQQRTEDKGLILDFTVESGPNYALP